MIHRAKVALRGSIRGVQHSGSAHGCGPCLGRQALARGEPYRFQSASCTWYVNRSHPPTIIAHLLFQRGPRNQDKCAWSSRQLESHPTRHVPRHGAPAPHEDIYLIAAGCCMRWDPLRDQCVLSISQRFIVPESTPGFVCASSIGDGSAYRRSPARQLTPHVWQCEDQQNQNIRRNERGSIIFDPLAVCCAILRTREPSRR